MAAALRHTPLCLLLATWVLGLADVAASGAGRSPVVIVPGDGSNILEARLDKPSTVAWYCSKKADWFRLWLDTANLLAATTCWADNIKLVYDEDRDEITNNAGVETRVPDFGGTYAIEELDPSVPLHKSAAWRDIVISLVDAGYKRNVTLRGAPYDFRYAPSSAVGAQYTERLRELIEETATSTGARVSLLSHSMGGLQVHYLLGRQSQEWKDKYIERWITMGAPWGGSAQEMRLMATGDNEGVPTVNPLTIREEQRSYETNFWLAPVPRWFGNRTLVSTPSAKYSAQNYSEFFDAVSYPAGKKIYKRIQELTSGAEAPGVDVVCMYSLGVGTPLQYNYDEDGFDKAPTVVTGDGDGTVNDFSLKLCERWTEAGAQGRPARVVRFTNIKHAGMLTDPQVLAALNKELGVETQTGRELVV